MAVDDIPGGSVPRSSTSVDFQTVKRSRSFYLPPRGVYRSKSLALSAGWQEVPYPHPHKGRLGALFDLLMAIYHEIPVLAPLISKLMRLLGLGVKAYSMLFRLVVFAFSLSPAIVKAGIWWWRSATISRGVPYGSKARNFLDIYHVARSSSSSSVADASDDDDVIVKRPVVVYLTGGAWIIGYKAWAAPLGEYMTKNGVMLVSIDYRNFPQGTLKDMQEDLESALNWIWENIDRFGGDKNNITLVGQSAGAHILTSVVLKKASKQVSSGMPLDSVKKVIGVSGPYDIVSLAPLMNKRGLYSSMLKLIMDNDLFAASPKRVLSSMSKAGISRIPPILLLHGTSDSTVPFSSSVEFHEALKKNGVESELELWPNVTHSEPIVEGPAGGMNFFGSRLVLEATGAEGPLKSEPLMNERLIKLAKFFMPF